jgi:hypothetical protein
LIIKKSSKTKCWIFFRQKKMGFGDEWGTWRAQLGVGERTLEIFVKA